MKHDRVTDEIRETAALYSLGALAPEERAAFAEHLTERCPICEAEVRAFEGVTGALGLSVPPAAAPADLRARLLARAERGAKEPAPGAETQIWKNWEGGGAAHPWFLLRANEGSWEETGVEGVRARRLFVDTDRQTVTMLVKMAAGTAYPTHRHAAAEECYVLEGDLHVGDTVMRAGDYQRAGSGTMHGVQSTEGGCTLLIVSSLHDELVE